MPLRSIIAPAALASICAIAQSAPAPKLPRVIASSLLIYPVDARMLGISGIVQLKVTTDGSRATSVECLSGPPTLVDSSVAFVKSWRFIPHKRTSFQIQLDYKLLPANSESEDSEISPSNETLSLHLPTSASIESTIIPNGCAGLEVVVQKTPNEKK